MTDGNAIEFLIDDIDPIDFLIADNQESLPMDLGTPLVITGVFPDYEGVYHVTPSDEVQILSTRNTSMYENVTIDPIPSNYGRVTYNGTFITIS